jgi:hypothetical protein
MRWQGYVYATTINGMQRCAPCISWYDIRMKRVVVTLLFLLHLGMLVACADTTTTPIVVSDESLNGGGTSPEVTVENFLSDLNKALKDPAINRTDVRDQWADTLSNYFVPVERGTQRIAIRSSLDNLAAGVAQLNADETVSFDIQFEPARRIKAENDTVVVEVPNAMIAMVINRNSNRGNVSIWSQNESLGYLIGNNSNTFPVVQVGVRWFLTEN